jgi:hypothetical protein
MQKLVRMTYAESTARYNELQDCISAAGARIKALKDEYGGGPGMMGLSANHDALIRMPEYRAARQEYARLVAIARPLNADRAKHFKKEMQADRRAKYPNRFP